MTYRFSGHDTFHCRAFWLKKGFDFLKEEHKYSNPDAVVRLGVGKNMVNAIQFWLEAFGISEKQELTDFGRNILSDDGLDPYLEDAGTLWLLHYQLVATNYASIYSLMFNHFRKLKVDLTKDEIANFILNFWAEGANANTVAKDIEVFFRTYLPPKQKLTANNIEDELSLLLHELKLIREFHIEENQKYTIHNLERESLPYQIVLFAILDNPKYSSSISFYDLLNGENSPGSIFALSAEALHNKIQEIVANEPFTYKEDAGIRTLQSKTKIDKWDVLRKYYEQ